jgi:uncharacterized protein (TIGR02588 family)
LTRARRRTSAPRSWAEHVALAIALMTLAAVMAGVVATWRDPEERPARFTVTRGAVRTHDDAFYLGVTVRNEGDATAAEVTLEGRIGAEVASTTFDFVPGGSEASAVLIFRRDPQEAAIRVVSYQEP